MKKLLAIFFLFTFLSANTAFGEVLKLPMLVQHYLEHTDEEKDLTVFSFLMQHYTTDINHHHQQNHNHHDKLPFKTTDCHASQVVTLVPQPTFSISQIIPETIELKKPINKQQNYSNAYLNSIWQPPRFS